MSETNAPAAGVLLGTAAEAIMEADLARRHGFVSNLIGLIIEATGLQAEVGEVCLVGTDRNRAAVSAEVVGFRDGRTLLMPLGELHGIGPGTRVLASGAPFRIAVGDGLLGRIVDGLGIPEDGGTVPRAFARSTIAAPPNALSRPRITERVGLGVRALDGLVPCGLGQRLGIFAGSGVGKSSLLGMIARSTSASINVIALVGERGREVREFVERDLGDALERSVVVVATSDQPALVRIKAAFTATTIAEYFRDQGHDVMLMMDSVTRFAMAQREVGLAIGEPPATRGYTPSVFALLAPPARARRHQREGLDHRPLHRARGRRRHERADRRRRALDPRRTRRAHPLARPRRALPADRRPAERLPPRRRDRLAAGPAGGAAAAQRARGAAREGRPRCDRRLPARQRPPLDTALSHRTRIERFLRQSVHEHSDPQQTDARLLELGASLASELEERSGEIPDAEVLTPEPGADSGTVDGTAYDASGAPAIPALGLNM